MLNEGANRALQRQLSTGVMGSWSLYWVPAVWSRLCTGGDKLLLYRVPFRNPTYPTRSWKARNYLEAETILVFLRQGLVVIAPDWLCLLSAGIIGEHTMTMFFFIILEGFFFFNVFAVNVLASLNWVHQTQCISLMTQDHILCNTVTQ